MSFSDKLIMTAVFFGCMAGGGAFALWLAGLPLLVAGYVMGGIAVAMMVSFLVWVWRS